MLNKVEHPVCFNKQNKPGNSKGYLFGQWPLLRAAHDRAPFLPVSIPDAIR